MAVQKNTAAEAADFLNDFAGQGIDSIGDNAVSQAYLGIVQPGSTPAANGHEPGTWRNSSTDENYGNIVRVVPVAFKTIWSERSSEPPFTTVGRYEPNSIEVETKLPKAGQRGYPKMINPKTDNEIQELFVYACILPDYPEAGVVIFNPTVGSMKACKNWNAQIRAQLLPNGKPAPIFAYSWNIALELVDNPNKPTEKVARLAKVVKDALVDRELFEQKIQPQMALVNNAVLSITADDPVIEE